MMTKQPTKAGYGNEAAEAEFVTWWQQSPARRLYQLGVLEGVLSAGGRAMAKKQTDDILGIMERQHG